MNPIRFESRLAPRHCRPGTLRTRPAAGFVSAALLSLASLVNATPARGQGCYHYEGTPQIIGGWDTPGASLDVAVSGNVAYIADWRWSLQIVDISDPTGPLPLASVNVQEEARSVAVAGDYVYVAGSSHLKIFDVTNPSLPVAKGSISLGYLGSPELAVAGGYAYVTSLSEDRLYVVDVTNPNSPTVSGFVATPSAPYGLAVSGNFAYMACTSSGLLIVNVANHAHPAIIGTFASATSATDVVLSGGIAFVVSSDSRLYAIDISNPTTPSLVGSISCGGSNRGLTVIENRLFVAAGSIGIAIMDVTNPASMQLVTTVDTPGWAEGVGAAGENLCVGDGYNGLEIIGTASEGAPLVGNLLLPNQTNALAVQGDYAYMSDGGLHAVDVSDPSHPVLRGYVSASRPFVGVAVSGNYAYVGGETLGFQVVDISDPDNPTIVATVPMPPYSGQEVVVNGNHAYVTSGGGGLTIFDISNPAAPFVTATYDTPSYSTDLAVRGSIVYLTDIGTGLYIISATDPYNPVLLANLPMNQTTFGVGLAGNYAYITGYRHGGLLQIADISNPSNPVVKGSLPFGGSDADVAVEGDFAYIASNSGGKVVVADISDPNLPTLVGSYDSLDWPREAVVSGDLVYTANQNGGLQILRKQCAKAPGANYKMFAGLYHAPKGNAHLEIADGLLFCSPLGASGQDGLSIDLNGSTGHQIAWPDGFGLDLDSDLGAVLATTLRGEVNNVPESTISVVRQEVQSGRVALTADFSPVGATAQTIEISNAGTTVYQQTVPNGQVVLVHPANARGVRIVKAIDKSTPLMAACRFGGAQVFEIGGAVATGDEVVITRVGGQEAPSLCSLQLQVTNPQGAQLAQIAFRSESIRIFDLWSVALGAAEVVALPDSILGVGNIGAGGQDGLAVDIGEKFHYEYRLQDFGTPGSYPAGATFRNEIRGFLDGVADSRVASLLTTVVDSTRFRHEADFSPLGGTGQRIEVFHADTLKAAFETPSPLSWEEHSFSGTHRSVQGSLRFEDRKDSEQVFTISGIGDVLGDRVRISPLNPSHTAAFLSGVRLTGEGINSFTFTGVNTSLPTSGVDEAERIVSTTFSLDGILPNPSRGVTTIRWRIPVAGGLTTEIFDVSGRLIRRIRDSKVAAGDHLVRWDGRDRADRQVPAGVYLVRSRLATPNGSERSATGRFVILR